MKKIENPESDNIQKIKESFKLLSKDEMVGTYNRCEVTEIFGILNKKKVFNIFTLIVFENSAEIEEKDEYLTKGLNKLSNNPNIKWGISRKIISKEKSEIIFDKLIDENQLVLSDEVSDTGKLVFNNKTYVPPTESGDKSQVNNILKNNFDNGSYIIEAFDIEKENTKFLIDNPELLNSFSESISDVIPISIGSISDRLGNIIFQYPINIFHLEKECIKPDKGIKINLTSAKGINCINRLNAIVSNVSDNNVLDFKMCEVENNKNILFSTSNTAKLEIVDNKNNLILYSDVFSTVKGFNIDLNIISNQNRVFKLNNNTVNVKVSSRNNEMLGEENKERDKDSWIYNRIYEEELKKLEKQKSFMQYYHNEHNKALEDIRWLIERYGSNGVYLWDPYLSVHDIKETLYYTPYINVSLRAITNLKDTKQSSKEELKDKMKNEFNEDDKKYLLMNLEVRSKFGQHGWNFHDRFLLFPLERPKVWSLGISVNQLGESHHIVQEVRNAQHILNAFNELWDELDNEECLVWKSM